LKYLLDDEPPQWDVNRIESTLDILYSDLERQEADGLVVSRNTEVAIPGLGIVCAPILLKPKSGPCRILDVSGALTPNQAAHPEIQNIQDLPLFPVRIVDEIMVRKNLPRTTSDILGSLS